MQTIELVLYIHNCIQLLLKVTEHHYSGVYRCRMDNGQCDCRPYLIGRQCSDVEPGYFCAALDYYTYEAEGAVGHSPASADLSVSTTNQH